MTTPAEMQPIPVTVHGVSAEVSATLGAPPPRTRTVSCRPYTVVLTSDQPVAEILAWDDTRLYALVQAGGSDVVINNSKAEALAPQNQAAGLAAPIGMILPYGNTTPTKIPGGRQWFAAAAAYPAQVTVLAVMGD
jgi:hypothetical protein